MIKEYIQFAIDNGYPMVNNFNIEDWDCYTDCELPEYSLAVIWYIISFWEYEKTCYPLTDIITSKEFIEAVAIGKSKIEWMMRMGLYTKSEIMEYITIKQARAIRDNKLEEFITNLLWKAK